MNKLMFFALIAIFDYGFAQRIILPENDISRTYVASIHGDFNLVGPTSNGTFLCIGTFFKRGSIVTAASCVADRANNADNLFVTASSTLKGHPNGGVVTDLFRIRSIHIHPGFNPNNPTENNLAILNLNTTNNFFEPREITELHENRFCSMIGWEYPERGLHLVSTRIVNATTCFSLANTSPLFCGIVTIGHLSTCRELVGSPITCGPGTISAIVVQDNFCESNARGYLISLAAHWNWIDDVSSAAKAVKVSILALVAVIIAKLVM